MESFYTSILQEMESFCTSALQEMEKIRYKQTAVNNKGAL